MSQYKKTIYTEPNPILREPIRLFAKELMSKVEKHKNPLLKQGIRKCIECDYFPGLQWIIFCAKILKVKFPKLKDIKILEADKCAR